MNFTKDELEIIKMLVNDYEVEHDCCQTFEKECDLCLSILAKIKRRGQSKMLVYEILTWLIILLGKLRYSYLKKFYWKTGFYIRRDRNVPMTAEQVKYIFKNQCCDCGLVHSIENGATDWYPIRPKNYKYWLR